MDDTGGQRISVNDYLASLDEQTQGDAHVLYEMMHRISREVPVLWNVGTIGFGSYHYRYATGREGDNFVIGFYPRKGKTTVYLMDGTARHAEALSKLGAHTITGYCIHFKRLSDIDPSVLEDIVRDSYEYLRSLSRNGPIDRILWQADV